MQLILRVKPDERVKQEMFREYKVVKLAELHVKDSNKFKIVIIAHEFNPDNTTYMLFLHILYLITNMHDRSRFYFTCLLKQPPCLSLATSFSPSNTK